VVTGVNFPEKRPGGCPDRVYWGGGSELQSGLFDSRRQTTLDTD